MQIWEVPTMQLWQTYSL